MHLPTFEEIESMPSPTPENPLRILVSACLGGALCGIDGTSNGDYPWIRMLISLPNVRPITFCPEDFSFGTPRSLPDIHGGNGFDVLDGKARVLDEKGQDLTEGMIKAAYEMLNLAKNNNIHIAILMDMSAACGSQVISDGCRLTENRKYQQGPGVASALLLKEGFKVIGQRDFKTLEYLHHKLDPSHEIDQTKIDHHENNWYRSYFKVHE